MTTKLHNDKKLTLTLKFSWLDQEGNREHSKDVYICSKIEIDADKVTFYSKDLPEWLMGKASQKLEGLYGISIESNQFYPTNP